MIGIGEARLNYWYGRDGDVQTVDLELTEDLGYMYFSGEIIAEHTTKLLHYNFTVSDLAGNTVWTETLEEKVVDNDKPDILDDTTPLKIERGQNITFRVNATDNIGVDRVEVIYRFGSQMGLANYTYYDWWWDELYVDVEEWLDADSTMELVHTGGHSYYGELVVPPFTSSRVSTT